MTTDESRMKLKDLLSKAIALHKIAFTADPHDITFFTSTAAIYLRRLELSELNESDINAILNDDKPIGYLMQGDIAMISIPFYYKAIPAALVETLLEKVTEIQASFVSREKLEVIMDLIPGNWERPITNLFQKYPDLELGYNTHQPTRPN